MSRTPPEKRAGTLAVSARGSGTCRDCGKVCYRTRAIARQARRVLYPTEKMHAYRCGDFFHIGHDESWRETPSDDQTWRPLPGSAVSQMRSMTNRSTMIEHTPVEVETPVSTPGDEGPPSPPPANRPSVRDVLVGCLSQRLPCPVCERLESCRCLPPEGYSPTGVRATLIEQALVLYGYLPDPEHDHPFDAEETAEWLAGRSGHPRYVQVKDGWQRLIESEADVELAAIHAGRRVPSDEVDMVKAARAALLAWHQRKP